MAETKLKEQALGFYATYGSYVLYRILAEVGKQTDHSVYIPKTAFVNQGGPYPDKVLMTITVSPDATWNKP